MYVMTADRVNFPKRLAAGAKLGTNIHTAYTAPTHEAIILRYAFDLLRVSNDVTASRIRLITKFVRNNTSAYTINFISPLQLVYINV